MRLTSFLSTTVLVSTMLWAILLPVHARCESIGEEVVVCEPACGEKQCGEDGCGGSCGTCSPFEVCQAGSCSFNGGCESLTIPGCGQCACESCTCALDPYCCTGKWDALCVARCSTQCGGCGSKVECGDGLCNGGEDCSNCITDCGKCPPACGAVTSVGCCAETTLLACLDGSLTITNCLTDVTDSCGWDPVEEQYGCGGEGADPAGNHPLLCPGPPVEDVVAEIVLPDACNGLSFTGCCDDGFLRWCDAGGLHSLDCGTNQPPYDQCGWNLAKGYYDCGGEAVDPSGAASPFCPALQTDVVTDDLIAPECKVGTLVAEDCDTIPWEGCCDDAGALFFCEAGNLLCKLDCSGLVYPSNTCGWHAGQPGYYDCGGDGGDPVGEFPYACPQTEVPEDVTGQDFTLATCPDVPEKGCCKGPVLHWCENGIIRDFDCGNLAGDPVFGDYLYCGSNLATDAADCLKKPDPSPPECVVETPEPSIEPLPDVGTGPADAALEVVAQSDLLPGDAAAADIPSETSAPDGSGLVFPPDGVVEPEPKSGKDGCGVGHRPTSADGWLLLAALALLLLAAPRNREAS